MKNTQEVWRDIANYEGYYKVSNLGIVKSVEREIEVEQNALRIIDGKRGHKIVKLKKKMRGKIVTQFKDKKWLFVC